MEQLAIAGGRPIRNEMLAYGMHWVDEQDIESVNRVLRGNNLIQGPVTAEFERLVAEKSGARYAVAFSSGTAALHGASYAAGIEPGDEAITTPITFVASSNCVLYQGGTPVFADIREDTYNIDPDEIERKITPRTKAIIPVDYTGQPVEMDRIRALADRHGLVIIQDAAHSLGATYDGAKVGSMADMTMFSFHPVKHVTSVEGGVIVTDNEIFFKKLQLFRSHGISRGPDFVNEYEGPWYYEMQDLGYHYRMTDVHAALGISQIAKLDTFIRRRRDIVSLYNEAFEGLPGLVLPYQHNKADSSWHIYMLRWKREEFKVDRRMIFEALRAENIGVNVHYIPVYLMPYYKKLGFSAGLCPKAELYYAEAITIPLFPRMTDDDARDVINAVKKVYSAYKTKNS